MPGVGKKGVGGKMKKITEILPARKKMRCGEGSTSNQAARPPPGPAGRRERLNRCVSRAPAAPSPPPAAPSPPPAAEEPEHEDSEEELAEEDYTGQHKEEDDDELDEDQLAPRFVRVDPQEEGGAEDEAEDDFPLGEDEIPQLESFVETDDEIKKLVPKASGKVWQRGPATLPDRPYADRHHVLIPSGDRSFTYATLVKPDRAYASIMGCIVRACFPGLVKLGDGSEEPAWTWRHYTGAPDVRDKDGKLFESVAYRVVYLFWEYFTMSSEGVPEGDVQACQ